MVRVTTFNHVLEFPRYQGQNLIYLFTDFGSERSNIFSVETYLVLEAGVLMLETSQPRSVAMINRQSTMTEVEGRGSKDRE